MTKKRSPHKRHVRALQRQTGMPYTAALAQVQKTPAPGRPCPDCGGYDIGTVHEGGGQNVQACNECPWTDQ